MAISPESIRWLGFPDDGRVWWIRWIDRINPNDPTGTATVEVILTPLDSPDAMGSLTQDMSFKALRARKSEVRRAKIHVSSLPLLSLGSLFLNGLPCGCLPLERRIFNIDLDWKRDFLSGKQQNPSRKPSWWDPRYAWNVLPVSAYPRGDCNDSFVSIFSRQNSPEQLVIPSSEIFRAFYAPETMLADALLSGPWRRSEVRNKIVNEEHTAVFPNGSWMIGLRNGSSQKEGWPVANLMLNDFGFESACHLTDEFPRDAGVWRGYARIKADVPFRWTRMRLTVEGFPLYDPKRFPLKDIDRFVGLRIVNFSLPSSPAGFPPELRVRLDNNASERAESGEKETDGPPVGHTVAVPDRDGRLPLTSEDSPDAGARAVMVAGDSFRWGGLSDPILVREMPKDGKDRQHAHLFVRKVDMSSTAGRPASGRNVGRISGVQGQVPVESDHAFRVLAQVLDDLTKSGKIASWQSVTEAGCEAALAFGPGYVALRIPLEFARKADSTGDRKLRQWIVPGRGKFQRQHRKIMIAKVTVVERTAYLLEIEPLSEQGGYCIGIAVFDDGLVSSGLVEIIRLAVRTRGVWTKKKEQLGRVAGCWGTWKHRYEDNEGARLSGDSLMRAIAGMLPGA